MTNVDEQEIGKFSELASRWWDPEGEFKPLHLINPLRLDFINQHSKGLFDKKVLDIGCGGGILAESMAKARRTSHRLRYGSGVTRCSQTPWFRIRR